MHHPIMAPLKGELSAKLTLRPQAHFGTQPPQAKSLPLGEGGFCDAVRRSKRRMRANLKPSNLHFAPSARFPLTRPLRGHPL